jgi:hypothetical protein
MGRQCITCEVPDAEAALLAGEPYSLVSARFGISDDALRNHMRNHVNQGITASSTSTTEEWRQFAGTIYDALAPWPEARIAVADKLRAFEERHR